MSEEVKVQDLQTGRVYPCRVGVTLQVGRLDVATTPDLPCADPHVSRRHCTLRLDPAGYIEIQDTSSYGTFVNGVRVEGAGLARVGDRLTLGHEYALAILVGGLGSIPTANEFDTPAPKSELGGSPTAPRMIGRYELLREIGRGGMGVVYLGRCGETGRDVAVKVIRGFTEEDVKTRFEREARLAADLGDYPAIVKVREWGVAGPHVLYLVMDFVDGLPLTRRIEGGLKIPVGVRLVARVARAVHYAHERGVVHRDLKPDNVLVTHNLQVRLTDFGIAKESGSKITMTGTAMGTPNYMAPEQLVDSKRAGPPADVYGLGGLLYSVLTRRPPIAGSNISKIIRQVQAGKVVSPSEHVPGLDPGIEAICLKALAFEPSERYASADLFARALESWLKLQGGESDEIKLLLPGE